MNTYYIGADVHCNKTELAVERKNKIIQRFSVPAISAIHHRDNIFRDDYERMVKDGITPSNARHAVARKLLTVVWGMWKNMSRFDESLC